MTPKILLVPGSTRTGSLNVRLAAAASRSPALAKADVETISLSDYDMPLFNADLEKESGQPDAAWALARLFTRCHGIVLFSPEYNAGVTPLLKNTLDWVSRIRDPQLAPFKSPVFAVASAAPGNFGGLRSLIMLRQILQLGLGALVIPEQMVVPRAAAAFGADGALADPEMQERFDGVLAALLARIRPAGA